MQYAPYPPLELPAAGRYAASVQISNPRCDSRQDNTQAPSERHTRHSGLYAHDMKHHPLAGDAP